MAKEVTATTFAQEVIDADGKVIVDFWAPWCGPCHAVAPVLDKIGDEKGVKVVKVNVDEEPDLAMQHNVQSLPTMIVFESGDVIARAVGAMPKSALESTLAL